MRKTVVVSVALFTLCVSAQVGADRGRKTALDPTEDLIRRGVDLRKVSRDVEALELFKQAFERSHAMRARAQMALAEQALGNWLQAETHLKEALASSDPWIAQRHEQLDSALRTIEQHLGSVEVRGGVPGAEVFLDGEKVAVLPLDKPLRWTVGSPMLEVRADGYATVSRRVVISGGGMARETVRLTRELESRAAANRLSSPERPPMTLRRKLAWAGIGAGAGFLAAGIIGIAVSESRAAHWNDDSQCLTNGFTRQQSCGSDLGTIEAGRAVAAVGFSVGAVLTVAGGVLFSLSNRQAEESKKVACGPAGLGATCAVRF